MSGVHLRIFLELLIKSFSAPLNCFHFPLLRIKKKEVYSRYMFLDVSISVPEAAVKMKPPATINISPTTGLPKSKATPAITISVAINRKCHGKRVPLRISILVSIIMATGMQSKKVFNRSMFY